MLWWNYQISPMNWIMMFMLFLLMIYSFSFSKMNMFNLTFKKNKYLKLIYVF